MLSVELFNEAVTEPVIGGELSIMVKNELLKYIAAIVTTLEETGGSPESILYIGTGMDFSKWNDLRIIMIGSDLIAISGNYVTLTERGRILAIECNKLLAEQKSCN